jgi:cytochrome P450
MPSFDAAELYRPEALEDPYPLYARMRSLAPVCPLEGTGVHFVGSFAAVEEAVRRHEEFSANLTGILMRGDDGHPRVVDLVGSGTTTDVIATADEPEHAVQRRIVQPSLAAGRVAALEAEVRAFTTERVMRFVAAGGGDWCDSVAESLPAFVLMNLLGLGKQDLETARRWAMMGGDLVGGNFDRARMQELLAETVAMTAFLGRLFDRALATPPAERAGNVTDALAAGVEAGGISRDQAVGILVILFGAAGESTASLLGSAVRLLAGEPALADALRRDPARIADFVEEAVRLEPPFNFHYRVAKVEAELCGTRVRAGERLMVSWAAANRDPEVFEEPDRLRVERSQGRRHLAFGRGIHFCVGAPIARMEVRVALEELLARTRRIELDPAQPPAHVPSIFVRRLLTLPLRVA